MAQFGDVCERCRWQSKRAKRSGSGRNLAKQKSEQQISGTATGRTRGAPLSFLVSLSIFTIKYRDVAQFGRALRSGRRSRRFESCHLDQKREHPTWGAPFFARDGAACLVIACNDAGSHTPPEDWGACTPGAGRAYLRAPREYPVISTCHSSALVIACNDTGSHTPPEGRQILRADENNRQPSLFIIPTNWNLLIFFILFGNQDD